MGIWTFFFFFWVTWLSLGAEGRHRRFPMNDQPVDEPLVPCEHRTRCAGNYSTLPFHARNCFCDPACLAYGDCCRDYRQGTGGTSVFGADSLKGTMFCRRNEDIDAAYELYIVDSCPRRYSNTHVRRKCENELAPEVFNRLPVTGRTSGVLYRNVYCAVCSGELDFVFWELAYKCSDKETLSRNVTSIDSADEFRRLIKSRCTLELVPPPGLAPRKCKSNIDKCDRRWRDNSVVKKCRSYTSYVYLDLETFKNKDCATCNNIVESSISCEDRRTPYLDVERTWELSTHTESTYFVYDINTKTASVRHSRSPGETQEREGKIGGVELGECPQGSVYDILTDECRCTVGRCLDWSVTESSMEEEEVLKFHRAATKPITKTSTRQPATTVATKPKERKTTTTTMTTTTTTTTVAATKRNAKTTVATKRTRPSKHTIPVVQFTKLQTPASTTTAKTIITTTPGARNRVSATSTTAVVAAVDTATSNASTSTATDKTIPSSTSNSDIFKLTDAVASTTFASSTPHSTIDTANGSSSVTVKAETVANVANVPPFGVLDDEEGSGKGVPRKTSSLKSTSRFSTIAITQGAKMTASADAIVTLATSRGTAPYLEDPSGAVLSNGASDTDIRNLAPLQNCSDTRHMFRYNRFQTLATFIATLVSMLGLLVTFVAILLLPMLLTMRGKILLSLTLCLFLGQLLYLLALPVHHQVACYWLGCALHYFVLTGFFWISVLAFDTSWSVIGDRLDAPGGCGRYVGYSLYAWLTPAAIVTAALVTDYLGADRFLIRPCYGEGACFIAGTFSLLLLLALPAGILTLISMFMYFLAASHACFEASKTAKSKTANPGTRGFTLLALCLALTLLVALTWVAGFVAAFYGLQAVWWVFLVLYAAQGVFVLAAFLCRRSVLNQLRNKARSSNAASSNADSQWSYRRDFATAKQRGPRGSDTEIIAQETCM